MPADSMTYLGVHICPDSKVKLIPESGCPQKLAEAWRSIGSGAYTSWVIGRWRNLEVSDNVLLCVKT